MTGRRFHVFQSLTAVQRNDGESMRVTIPANSDLIADGLYDADRIMGLRWERKYVYVFVQDLHTSCSGAAASLPPFS